MPRIGPTPPRTPKLPTDDELQKRVDKQSGGKTPAQIYDQMDPREVSPAAALPHSEFPGFQWDDKVLDEVMLKYGVADAKAVIKTAIALDAGDRWLTEAELAAAAKKHARYRKQGYQWSPAVLADVMTKKGIAEEGALLRAAQKVDDGDKVLTRAELERAADVLTSVVDPNDLVGVMRRVQDTAKRAGFPLTHLGDTQGDLPVVAIDVPAKKQPPRLRVVITGGVHGDEPCGTGAAALLLEQLANDPRMRDDVEWTIIPVVNPRGFVEGTRRTPEDMDLNRNFIGANPTGVHGGRAGQGTQPLEELQLMRDFFEDRKGEFDLGLDLHSGGSKRNGFWVLHKDSKDLATAGMDAFDDRWPVLQGDSRPYTLSKPGVAESGSTETLKDLMHDEGARWSMTVEAPGSVAYLDQVLGENEIVHDMVNAARVTLAAEAAASGLDVG
jgi:hypothetical protein